MATHHVKLKSRNEPFVVEGEHVQTNDSWLFVNTQDGRGGWVAAFAAPIAEVEWAERLPKK